jgi:prophage DNA circulation protein
MSLRKTDLAEAASFLRKVLAALLTSAVGDTAATGADLFRQIGALSASAEAAISAAQLGRPLLGCFEAAYVAGATLTTIGQVRSLITGQIVVGRAAVIVQQSCLRMALVEESRILANTAFVSRRDVDAYMARMYAAFDPAETFAADQRDTGSYRALISLHAAVSLDLATRGRPLPLIVSYSFPARKPALALSNRLYGDGSRAGALIAENKPFHPLFMPRSGIALSS